MTRGPVWIHHYSDGVVKVVLDRPEKANALSAAMLEALIAAMDDVAQAGARAMILTGTGKVFSAGADLAHAAGGLAVSQLWERLSGAVAALPCLTVAALNGTVAGGGCGMALACDIRIAAAGAQIFYPVMKLGFLPQPSDVVRLVDLAGRSRAAMILSAGQRIGTDEALAWGLFDRVVAPEALMDAALSLCAGARAAAPDHVAAITRMVRAAGAPSAATP